MSCFTLWCSSSSFEATIPFPDGSFPNTKRPPLTKAFVRPPLRQDDIPNSTPNAAHNPSSMLISSTHLVSQGLPPISKTDINWTHHTNHHNKLNYVRTLLIDNYDSYTYNIYQQLSLINNVPPVVVRNDEWTWEEACYYIYQQRAFDNIVISPGPGSPVNHSDIGLCLQLLHNCTDIPILGVCLGHQEIGCPCFV